MKFYLHRKRTRVVVLSREVVVKTKGQRLDSIQSDVEHELETRGVPVESEGEFWLEDAEGWYAVLVLKRRF